MQKDANTILLFTDQRAAIDYLSDDDAGQLFKAIYAYADEGDLPASSLFAIFSDSRQNASPYFSIFFSPTPSMPRICWVVSLGRRAMSASTASVNIAYGGTFSAAAICFRNLRISEKRTNSSSLSSAFNPARIISDGSTTSICVSGFNPAPFPTGKHRATVSSPRGGHASAGRPTTAVWQKPAR